MPNDFKDIVNSYTKGIAQTALLNKIGLKDILENEMLSAVNVWEERFPGHKFSLKSVENWVISEIEPPLNGANRLEMIELEDDVIAKTHNEFRDICKVSMLIHMVEVYEEYMLRSNLT